MGRGSSGSVSRNRDGGVSPDDIVSTRSMISDRMEAPEVVDGFLTVARDMYDRYGATNAELADFQIAQLKGRGNNAIAYYDGANIAINERFMNNSGLNNAYDACIRDNFHPSRGNRSAAEAVAAHEYGHALTDAAARRMGVNNLHGAANIIVREARQNTTSRGVVQLANKISRYATTSNAEAVAEAVSDVFCNGSNAHAESRAIVNVLNRYLG